MHREQGAAKFTKRSGAEYLKINFMRKKQYIYIYEFVGVVCVDLNKNCIQICLKAFDDLLFFTPE